MINSDVTLDPFSVVAQALQCPRSSLSMESAMYRDHGWDSFGHVSVIVALEQAYGISISNDEMMLLTTMQSIVELTERLQGVDQRGP